MSSTGHNPITGYDTSRTPYTLHSLSWIIYPEAYTVGGGDEVIHPTRVVEQSPYTSVSCDATHQQALADSATCSLFEEKRWKKG